MLHAPNGANPVLSPVITFALPCKHTEGHGIFSINVFILPCFSVCFRGELIKPEPFPHGCGLALRRPVLP
jgi:hypothetical protein